MANPFANMSKGQIYAALAGTAGIGGYLAYKHHSSTGSWNPFSAGSSSATPSATTSSTQIDPVTGLPYSQDNAVDPVTGLTYLAEAQQYGSVSTAEASVSQFGQTSASTQSYSTGYSYPQYTQGSSTVNGSSVYTSNSSWDQAATAGLVDIGYDATSVSTALGLYLTGQPLTSDQASIVNTAIGEFGSPPVGNLQVILQPASSPSGTTTGSSPSVPAKPATPGGFSATGHTGFADFGWGSVANATSYELLVTGAGGKGTGTSHVDQTLTGTHAENVKLAKGTYKASVRAINSVGDSAYTATQTFTVK